MSAIFLAKGNAYFGINKTDKDGNVIESRPAHFDTSDDGPCIALGKIDLDTMEVKDIERVYGDFQASGYLQDVLDLLQPKRQIDIPDFKGILEEARANGVDICEYCHSMNCRDCIITRWNTEELSVGTGGLIMANERLLYKDEFGYIHTVYEIDGKRIGDKDVKNKLFNYEQEEADGKLIHLPCKVGDTVYCIKNYRIYECKVTFIKIFTRVSMQVRLFKKDCTFFDASQKDFNKTVFLTKEEAERALEEREANG